MAYNLQSLITILEQILNPQQTRWIVDHNKPQLQCLLEKAESLQQILEKCPLTKIESLESQIRDASHKAEDMIESHMVDQMLSDSQAVSFTFSTPDLQQVMQELDSVMEQVVKLIEEETMSSGVTLSHDLSSKSIMEGVYKSNLVGVYDALLQLKDRLTGDKRKLEIVPIVGMGGIDYNMQAILLSLLRCIIGKECDGHTGKESHELKDVLYRSLFGRRYMVVLDDIWSIKFWDEIRMYLPDNNNGSRIVITTRESDVAKHANSHSKQHDMQLLCESESWNLLRQEAFGDGEDCPAALERIGRNIARNCGGLPLAICVIGGLLSKANMFEDVWENVANDVTTAAIVAESDKQFSDILSLSYNHLPTLLRPCFLYMGAFPEDYEIKASRLIRLWVAEGFLKSKGDKSMVEEAEDCLKALVDRNLISVRGVNSYGRAKKYGMHDLMRDLCLKKMEQQRFVHVGEKQGREVEGIRRVSIHSSMYNINPFYASEFMSLARSFLCKGPKWSRVQSPILLALRLLRVLDLLGIEFQRFPTELLQILNLHYLAFSCKHIGTLPSDISRLWNLQTLVISCVFGGSMSLPCEILQMAELRHVIVYGGTFCIDTDDGSDWVGFVLDKLQTIYFIQSSHVFLHRIPNVKKLGIRDTRQAILDLYHLHKLETLRLSRGYDSALISPSMLILSPSLKKLSLEVCEIVGEFLNHLCELPNLEVLKLKTCIMKSGEPLEWDATEQEFCKLKFLLLDGLMNLVKWEADETNFPRLRHLVIRRCSALEEIPFGIGEIATLQTIELDKRSSPSLVASAKLIIEEQRGNEQ